jgi:hypothetical protein
MCGFLEAGFSAAIHPVRMYAGEFRSPFLFLHQPLPGSSKGR